MTANSRIPTTITIADRAGRSFPVHAHAQGYARWKGGNVSIEEESPRAVRAKVRGEQIRDVRLQDQDGRLLVQCTCPSRTFERPGCKHVWAALLEIDKRGALAGLRSARTPLVVGFLEPKPTVDQPPPPKEEKPKTKKKVKKPQAEKKKVSPLPEPAADRASPRSPRASAAPREARGKPRRSPPRSSSPRR